MSSVACCMLHAVRRMLHAAIWRERSRSHARTHARAQRARADALVGMVVDDEAVERNASVAHALTVIWPQLPHMLCTVVAPRPSLQSCVGLQLAKMATAGTEKALLADVTEKNPDASYVELLRLFKVHRSRCT
jgi:hypothetical protein